MKFFSLIALLAFSGLTSVEIDPKKQTISEIYSKVSKSRQELDHAVLGYKQHKYGVFARQALKYEYSPAVSHWNHGLPADSTYDPSEDARRIYSELTLLKFVYPVISDPTKLSDALKIKALIYGIDKESQNDTTTPNFTELRQYVQQIIDEENKIGRNWTKTSLVLDVLYDKIDVNDAEAFIVTSGYPAFALENLSDFCVAEKNTHCTPQLLKAIIQFKGYNIRLQKLLPFETEKEMEMMIKVLENYQKQKNIIDNFVNNVNMHLYCDAAGCRINL